VVDRTPSLVLEFFAFAWSSLVVILLVEPEIYDSAMKLPAGNTPSPISLFWAKSRPSSFSSPSGC
jgi:hypothetical protein